MIKQVPTYAKFLKDLCTIKRGLNVNKKAFLSEQVSAIIQCKSPLKYIDPGCPTISVMIGGKVVEKALLDLGASVNLLPYSVYKQLGLGELKPTSITLSLADRPFLATSNAIINCRNGLMQLTFGNMTLELNIFYTPEEEEGPERGCLNPLICLLLYKVGEERRDSTLFNKEEAQEAKEEFPKLNLKPLPMELKYIRSGKDYITSPFGTYAYKRMPFGLCNAPATFQRCMLSIFSDMVERIMEVFMDDITIYGGTYEECLVNLEAVLNRCIEKDLVLNWEKCHFMIHQGIVLGHIISKKGIEVDKAKVELIVKLPSPTTIKGVRQFLGHVGFYRRFIQDFSKLSKPLCEHLAKDAKFIWDERCQKSFDQLKQFLTTAPIVRAPNWQLPFEVMCDASDFAIAAVLGQREDGKPYVIYYANKTFNETQRNYTTTEKELLAVVFALDKFRAYLESLMLLEKAPWYAHIANYLVIGEVPSEWKAQDRKHFFAKIHAYYWEEPFLFKYCADQIIRKCVLEEEQ
ncbi:Retrovirus-related Pol polyprotein from transposon opus [Vitis vinifera]|uniref:Retrovirus-related Pol polyprotein from transposon opus n=1 Tax=Vitis vinifera TaxID=29760 RepID=A0A438C8N4_VITVI|nr:Retrovirus-related Pol polyprotein from transposon opus [Vitis vinifera]